MAYKRNELNVEQLEALVRGRGKKFVSLKEGADLYSLGLHSFREIAKDAKAIYKIKRRVLVNTEKVDEFLEAFALDDD
ncbi:MAG: DUF6462 family protein [Blautia sp.]|nr:DUF6462 family protein [Blautia sp.]